MKLYSLLDWTKNVKGSSKNSNALKKIRLVVFLNRILTFIIRQRPTVLDRGFRDTAKPLALIQGTSKGTDVN